MFICLIVVSTSLTAQNSSLFNLFSRSERKHVGVLDIRGQSYRLRPIPLIQVRPFATAEISLKNEADDVLDAEDPNVDERMADVLSDHVEALIKEARAQAKILREDAEREARATAVVAVRPFGDANESLLAGGQKYRLEKPDQISVRLKV